MSTAVGALENARHVPRSDWLPKLDLGLYCGKGSLRAG